jgi:drug/metabolite transporter (DMT)-like permease
VAVLGAVFCGSVVAGNVSLRYLPVSFNQAVGATTPFFTALIAYAIAARREAGATYAALIPVVAGVVIATGVRTESSSPINFSFKQSKRTPRTSLDRVSDQICASIQGEPSFHLFGFVMCVGATAGRALKTVLQGILLSSEE